MQKLYLFSALCIFLLTNSFRSLSQNVGIGTTTPNATALLHVNLNTSQTKGLLVTGTYNSSSTMPNLGSGSRLMFYPGKAAFRAGFIDAGTASTNWDNANVGFFSSATGYNTVASGQFSTATGSGNTASGYASSAMGEGSSASNNYSIATGYHTQAIGSAAIAMGSLNTAGGTASAAMGAYCNTADDYSLAAGYYSSATNVVSVAIGNHCTNSAAYSVAMGSYANASGYICTSIGHETNATGPYCTAIGYKTAASGNVSMALGALVNTNNQMGAFIIGDTDPNNEGITYSGYPDEFVARFNNGYYFMTSGNTNRFGVSIGHNGNAWVSICSKDLKENFQPLNGEDVLQKLSKINFTSWNYKRQDPKIYRHYGIMAQDFYQAFGRDNYGTIGNDTTVNPIDMIGIDMTAIQALEKRTNDLKNVNNDLKEENSRLSESIAALQNKLDEQQKLINEILLLTKQKTGR